MGRYIVACATIVPAYLIDLYRLIMGKYNVSPITFSNESVV